MTQLSVKYGKKLDLTDWADVSDQDFDAMEPFQWGGEHPLKDSYPTPTGKARMVAVTSPEAVTDDAFPLRLNTARYRDQWHTMTRTGLSPTLSTHRPEPLAEVHPADTKEFGLVDGGLARLSTASGTAVFRVSVSDAQRPGEICVPMHWTDVMAGEGRSNRLPDQGTDPFSGQPGFKNTPAAIEPVQPEWRAFLVVRDEIAPQAVLYWTRSRQVNGWLYELAGNGAVDIDALLPAGQRLEVADAVRGMRRVAVRSDDGSLLAALYLTRSGELPRRDWVAAQLGGNDAESIEILAGRPSMPLPDRGPIVCVCHGVGENDICAAVSNGANSVNAIGEVTSAGTNCGSCRPAIARLLETMQTDERQAAE